MPTSGISRVSNSLQTLTLLAQLQRNTLRLFGEQQRLSTGKALLSVSDDPDAAEKIARLRQSLGAQSQILVNLRHADDYLSAADSQVGRIGDILTQAAAIASEQAGGLHSPEDRAAQALLIDGLIEQLVTIANNQFQGSYLFGGRDVRRPPVAIGIDRVTVVGDAGPRETTAGAGATVPFNISVAEIFNLRERVSGGYAGFDSVQLTGNVRLSELDGAIGSGVRLGVISVIETGPDIAFQVDFTGAETVQDLIDRFTDAAASAGSALTLDINPADRTALRVVTVPGSGVQIDEAGTGTTATDLGIRQTTGAGVDLLGTNLQRRVTLTTALADLAPGGVVLGSGVVVTNGSRSAVVSFAGATTVQDVLNRLNTAGVGIRASINAAADGIEIENLIAGTPLRIGENGGTDAEILGIRTVHAGIELARLNRGRGIYPVSGADIRITDADGIAFDVDLSAAVTVGDVIAAINAVAADAGANITAETSPTGAGLRLTGPGGPQAIRVEAVNLSPVASELGILKTGTSTELVGDDVGLFYQSGVFSALYRLRDALAADQPSEITLAGGEINELQRHVASVAGQVGARAQSVGSRRRQTEDAVTATRVLLSSVDDVDFAEAVTKFQQAQTALQATLLAGARAQNLSLLDFLR